MTDNRGMEIEPIGESPVAKLYDAWWRLRLCEIVGMFNIPVERGGVMQGQGDSERYSVTVYCPVCEMGFQKRVEGAEALEEALRDPVDFCPECAAAMDRAMLREAAAMDEDDWWEPEGE